MAEPLCKCHLGESPPMISSTSLIRFSSSYMSRLYHSLTITAWQDISFNEQAFNSLNLPRNQKDLILGFTSVKQSYRNQFDDVIEGKGKVSSTANNLFGS